MENKGLQSYVAPQMEIIEMEVENAILQASDILNGGDY